MRGIELLGVPRKIYRATGNSTICYQLTDFTDGYDCAIIEIYGTANTGYFNLHALVFVGKQTSITTSNTHIYLMVGTTTDFNTLVEIYTDGEDIFIYPKMSSGGGVVFTQSSCNIPPTVVKKDKSSLTRIDISQ